MNGGFLERAVVVGDERFPSRVRPVSGAPVLLFLHGAGERGCDGALHLEVGLPASVAAAPEAWPFTIVAPQCPEGRYWPHPRAQAIAEAALADALALCGGDRVAVTGVSMGGYGALELAVRRPGRFAALAVVCGGVAPPGPEHPALCAYVAATAEDPYVETARRIGRVPVWLFHGEDDDVVPAEESRRLEAALRAAGGDVRLTEYAGVKHDSWGRAYAEPELAPWLSARLRG